MTIRSMSRAAVLLALFAGCHDGVKPAAGDAAIEAAGPLAVDASADRIAEPDFAVADSAPVDRPQIDSASPDFPREDPVDAPSVDLASDVSAVDAGADASLAATCTGFEPQLSMQALGSNDGCGAPSGTFGLTTTADLYTVDTGGGLVFSVRRTDPAASTQSMGDLSSLKYKGQEYQDQTRGSHVGVGLSGGKVTATTYGTNYIKIMVTASDGGLTHYYIAKNGCSNIYMATHFTSEPSLGNVRFLTGLRYSLLPNGPAPSDLSGNTGAIEASDVFGLPSGQTRSKHYSNHRQMEWTYTGATGTNVGVWMVKGNQEGMSSGPFYRSLINQASSGADQEIYALINYAEAQIEPNRTSILNTYTLVFNDGSKPGNPDLAFEASLDLVGYVGAAARGSVLGVGIAGRNTCYPYVIGFANPTAQYWAVQNSNGTFASYGMIPGDYAITVYKGELAVWTGAVTVTAGASTNLHTITISDDPSSTPTIWRIGDWDGTPLEFLNGDKLTTMHPQDSRMASWGPVTYVVGTSTPKDFPAYQFRGANSPTTIKFKLSAAEAAVAHTLNIGITIDYINARPSVTINDHALAVKGASDQPNTRSLTVGTYRGNNTTFSWSVPASYFVPGENVITISPISGSSDLGKYLSASYAYDCVELVR